MKIEYHRQYSGYLDRDMEFKVYGHGGKPVIFVPCQGGRYVDFENFKMIDYWGKFIEEGCCTVYSVDTIDNETYANKEVDPRWRVELHEKWYNYLIEEMVPTIRYMSGDQPIMVFGASLGAMHAANLFFRRPDIFDAVFAISGIYESEDSFGNYMDDILYRNTPCAYIPNMAPDHPYIEMYNNRKMLFVVGQVAWEDVLLASTRNLQYVLEQKGIHAQFDYWGHDVDHDWPWWYIMVQHYLPQFLY